MLPTQGQGASQSIEDAEALGAFFADVVGTPSAFEIEAILKALHLPRFIFLVLTQMTTGN